MINLFGFGGRRGIFRLSDESRQALIQAILQELRNDPAAFKGEKGEKGETGPTGAVGAQGTPGVKGNTGTTGNTGAQGIQGIKGDTGSQGPIGLTGPQGTQGTQGLQGATGPQGLKGDKGDTEVAGIAVLRTARRNLSTQLVNGTQEYTLTISPPLPDADYASYGLGLVLELSASNKVGDIVLVSLSQNSAVVRIRNSGIVALSSSDTARLTVFR